MQPNDTFDIIYLPQRIPGTSALLYCLKLSFDFFFFLHSSQNYVFQMYICIITFSFTTLHCPVILSWKERVQNSKHFYFRNPVVIPPAFSIVSFFQPLNSASFIVNLTDSQGCCKGTSFPHATIVLRKDVSFLLFLH